jgi:hypothetical protein
MWLGSSARTKIRNSGGALSGDGQAKAGIALGIAALIVWFLVIVVAVANSGSTA